MNYNKDIIKQSISLDQMFDLISDLGGEPVLYQNFFISRTICHNPPGTGSYKLYYYNNTQLFKCYTECEPSTFDIFELLMKINHCDLYHAIIYVTNYFNIPFFTKDVDNGFKPIKDWDVLNKYERNSLINQSQIIEINTFDESTLQYLPNPRIIPWEQEGISYEVMQHRHIAYDPVNEGIIIPHYNIDGALIGVRERTLIQEEEKKGKYKPANINHQTFNHPLSFNLYNLNNSKENIKLMHIAIVLEGEKSCLKMASLFGENNDISVATCGSSLSGYQVQLLLSLQVKEIVIAFDKQFKELNDKEHKQWCKKLTDIYHRYSSLVQISYMFDKNNLLQYKESPIDEGKEIFLQLFKERIFLE